MKQDDGLTRCEWQVRCRDCNSVTHRGNQRYAIDISAEQLRRQTAQGFRPRKPLRRRQLPGTCLGAHWVNPGLRYQSLGAPYWRNSDT